MATLLVGACATRLALVAEKGKPRKLPQSMRLIHEVGGWEKLTTKGAMQIVIRGI